MYLRRKKYSLSFRIASPPGLVLAPSLSGLRKLTLLMRNMIHSIDLQLILAYLEFLAAITPRTDSR
jgi:hypothetical protein